MENIFLLLQKLIDNLFWKKHRFIPSDLSPSVAIKIPVTKWRRAKNWGDFHMAELLKKELEAIGYNVLIQILSEWYNDEGNSCDITIVFRGLSRYQPKSHQINLMWNISHPDQVSVEEYEEYDKVFIASHIWASTIEKKVTIPVEAMLQCTDKKRFYPPNEIEKKKYHHELLFVANSRGMFRQILKDLLPTTFNLAVYGKNWKNIIPKNYIKSKYIKNNELFKYYGSTEILLNDHWQDMREKGFISNRIYDGLASGAFIITDKVAGMGELTNIVQAYETKEQLNEYVKYYLKHPEKRREKSENGMKYIKNHTFKDRAKQFSVSINNLLLAKKKAFEKKGFCNICESLVFKAGPLGRLSKNGDKPQCTDCGSLERHRLIRTVWDLLPQSYLNQKKALQFSLDPSVDTNWFDIHEVSIYGHTNSLDLQKIDRVDHSYDIVICNQILEHVKDDKSAFSELLRVIKKDGFLQMTVPNPIKRKLTEDWGYPKENFHGHYRHYGIDLIEYFKQVIPGIHMINVKALDQVTGDEDFVFFWTQNKITRDLLLDSFVGHVHVERYF